MERENFERIENIVSRRGANTGSLTIKSACYLTLHLAGYIFRTVHEMSGHEHVEDGDDTQRYHVVDEEATYEYRFRVVWSKFLGKRIAYLQLHMHIRIVRQAPFLTVFHYEKEKRRPPRQARRDIGRVHEWFYRLDLKRESLWAR